ncbi:hypothetical protein FIBSPDRAFT_855705 [Athelia psychrophila]|uniref:F-box domain-containing protein n=1 Tax=Athelia psychrophila TaxID=1759441 RepID=A0A166NYV1_9AGAM|nr:hypothetical protein FIBSPDRAFT_855705 [Fibularhizoctonia sp. CBS 109695]
MHQALFIDEIVRHIFSFSADDAVNNGYTSLCRSARCCKTWQEPALDALWSQLFCAAPLIRLIPGVLEKDGVFTLPSESVPDLDIFCSYARRVRIITHRHRRPMDPCIVSLLQSAFSNIHVLPQLSRASISVPSWDAFSVCMAQSPSLRQLTLDLGFNRARIDAKGWSNDEVAAGYLEGLISSPNPSIEQMELRGLALGHPRIASSLVSLGASMRFLTLTTGASLSPSTLAGVVTFPRLEDLEVHAGHISSDDLAEALKAGGGERGVFPALRKLRVRAQAPLVELLLGKMASCQLAQLHLEAVSQPQGERAHNWAQTFALIPAKAASTLQELTIEHHLDLPMENEPNANIPIPIPSSASPAGPDAPSGTTDTATWTLTSLRPFEPLTHLRRLVLDTTLPPCLNDADMEILARWWPKVEHLELGGLVSDLNCVHPDSTNRTTLACLHSFAKWCTRLETLVLNLDVTAYPSDAQCGVAQTSLRNLALGSTLAPEPADLARYLGRVFPALEIVDGIPKFEDEFKAANCLMHPAN